MSEKKEQKFFFEGKEVSKEEFAKLSKFDSYPREPKKEPKK